LALGGHCFIFSHNNQLIVRVSNGRDDGKVALLGWGVRGVVVSLFGVAN
jgi:hypothetical protein